MELSKQYSVAYKGLKNSTYDFDFEVGDALFAAYESKEILGGSCQVKATMRKGESQLEMDFVITGSVTCECDRCLEPCSVPIDYEGSLVVRISDEEGEYDGDVMWVNPADNEVDFTQYIYESIVLSLPYQRVHPEGECNPDMMARFTIATEADLEALETEAQGDKSGICEGDFNKLAALKAQLEGADEKKI